MHALVTYLVKGSAYVLANEFVAFITFYVRKINVCLTILLFIPIITPEQSLIYRKVGSSS